MRLRYLRVQDNPPLHDVRIVFQQESVLQRDCAIRFVVGVNGTGKTRLLQAVAMTFLSLERRQQPPFPVTLAYDLGRGDTARTLLLRATSDGREAMTLVEFDEVLGNRSEEKWEALAGNDWGARPLLQPGVRSLFTGGDLPGGGAIAAYLPRVLLTYTSGATTSWEQLFMPAPIVQDTATLPLVGGEDDALASERPSGWTREQEELFQRQQGVEPSTLAEAPVSAPDSSGASVMSMGQLITPDALPLAFCAIALEQFVHEFKERFSQESLLEAIAQADQSGERMPGLRGLLNEVGWGWLEGVHIEVAFDPVLLTAPKAKPYLLTLKKLYELASAAVRQPEPSNIRRLHFDLFRPAPESPDQLTGEALFDVLRGESGTSYDAYRRLRDLQAIGLLTDLEMTLRRPGIDDLLLYDWLSDGERVFLGRMALFHLLAGEDDALYNWP